MRTTILFSLLGAALLGHLILADAEGCSSSETAVCVSGELVCNRTLPEEALDAIRAAGCEADVPWFSCEKLSPEIKMQLLIDDLAAAVHPQGLNCLAEQLNSIHPIAAAAFAAAGEGDAAAVGEAFHDGMQQYRQWKVQHDWEQLEWEAEARFVRNCIIGGFIVAVTLGVAVTIALAIQEDRRLTPEQRKQHNPVERIVSFVERSVEQSYARGYAAAVAAAAAAHVPAAPLAVPEDPGTPQRQTNTTLITTDDEADGMCDSDDNSDLRVDNVAAAATLAAAANRLQDSEQGLSGMQQGDHWRSGAML